jgi:superfamily II DNA or RNA helicase
MKGYIYIRTNEWCELKNIYKVGITKSIKDRNNSYITGEIIRGKFIKIFELDFNDNDNDNDRQLKYIDNIIKIKFKKLNVYFDAGTEFYDITIIDKIDEFLLKNNIKFKLVNEDELKRLNRKNKYCLNDIINKYIEFRKITPKLHQSDILDIIDNFYLNNNIGKLLWTCGLGKSLMSILITQKLNFKKIIIGVPSCFLQRQFANEIIQIFPNKYNIFIGSSTDNDIIIKSFISKITDEPLFIITTYHSCHLYINDDFIFDFKIADECHHLVGKDYNSYDKHRFILFHKINSIKTLYMTATIKTIHDNDNDNDDDNYSMNNEKIFGKTIDEKTFKWAIDKGMITNYKIIIIENQFHELMEIKHKISPTISNKELFICAYLTLKLLTIFKEKSPTHILIYTNEIKDAELANNYIKEILSYDIIDINIDDLYYNSLHSQVENPKIIEDGLKEFQLKKYGIISCVQLFGEGINCPIIDGITIACNMISKIKIVQYLLRANRIFRSKPDKIAYYNIPYLSNESYLNIRHIIKQLANVDETIEQKIMVSQMSYSSNSSLPLEKPSYEFISNPDLLLKIKMKLRNSKDLICDFTEEENEYNYIKFINKCLKLTSRIDYYNLKEKHENFIENPDKYFLNKGVWVNWCDFLGYDTSLFIPTKQKWINFCKEKEIKTIEDYKRLSLIHIELPKDPEDFYNAFSNIANELQLFNNKKRR